MHFANRAVFTALKVALGKIYFFAKERFQKRKEIFIIITKGEDTLSGEKDKKLVKRIFRKSKNRLLLKIQMDKKVLDAELEKSARLNLYIKDLEDLDTAFINLIEKI